MILQIAGTALDLAQSNFSLFGEEDPMTHMGRYAADLLARGQLSPDLDIFEDFNMSSYQGLGYFARGEDRFEALRTELEALVLQAYDQRAMRAAPALLAALRAGRWDRLVQSGIDDGGFGETAVLHHIPATSVADLILVGSRVNVSLLSALALRYRTHTRDGSPFEVERTWLGVLESTVLERAALLPAPFRDWAQEALEDRFGKIRTNFGAVVPAVEA